MLNNETKKKIDSCRDILVGKIPDPKAQVEQITIALMYKFMDDMDNDAVEIGGKPSFFVKEYEQYSWSNLMSPKIGGQERINLYAEAILKMPQNPHIPQLFRDIFKGAFLPYRAPETLRLFLKEINGFVYDHSEKLGDAYEYLLSIMSSQGDAGQFRTPRNIIDFIAEIVDPKKNDTVLDPACGTAGFLISGYKHILKKNKDKLNPTEKEKLMNNFVGYDISPDMVKISRVNMYLHKFPDPNIYEYDALSSQKRWEETFDVIMANPPFMSPKGGIIPHNRFTVKSKRSEVLFVDYIREHLNIDGRAGVIVPKGIISTSQNAYNQLRKTLIEENYLYAVVSLPAGVFNPYSKGKTSILLMDRNIANKTDSILFVKVENDGYDLGAQRRPIDKNDLPQVMDIINAWKAGKKTDNKLAIYVEKTKIAESDDYDLFADRYRTKPDHTNAKWPMKELKTVIETITPPTKILKKDFKIVGS
ncbi:MAG: N-6 DNA methylase, partial [Elusimicrobia bacterium]|nr:N-6 DNA methylase [Elusimicrobiota bacterium]